MQASVWKQSFFVQQGGKGPSTFQIWKREGAPPREEGAFQRPLCPWPPVWSEQASAHL